MLPSSALLRNEKFKTVKVSDEDEMYKGMEKMLDSGDIDGCVTMHYPFPIGVSSCEAASSPPAKADRCLSPTLPVPLLRRESKR